MRPNSDNPRIPLRNLHKRKAKPTTTTHNFNSEAICANNFGQGDAVKPAKNDSVLLPLPPKPWPRHWYYLDEQIDAESSKVLMLKAPQLWRN